ncbi:MAG TPA: HD domain-containing phosphohydrolase [Usitatibacter sp.]|nr:HD domain-containing phosphohydrolase [Usitatibacter sp.]
MSFAAAESMLAPTPTDSLRVAERSLGELGRAELAARLAPAIVRLQGPMERSERAELAAAALSFCQRLHGMARSGDALGLARAVLAQAAAAGDTVLELRATTACGLLCADIADVVGAIEYHVRALRLAGENRVEASGVWNNIGLALGVAGNYEMALRCYQRAVNLAQDEPGRVYSRYAALGNLVKSHFQLGSYREGLAVTDRALAEETAAFRDHDPMSVLRLRRNLVRLLVAAGRVTAAEPYVRECAALAQAVGTPRAVIAASTARAAYELATGRTDLALTRLERAVAGAREVPAALRDTLACAMRAEEEAGNTERALLRLAELSDHIHRAAVERARQHLELAGIRRTGESVAEHESEQTRARLISKLAPPAQPDAWGALDRLAVSAVLRVDPTGRHGKRVGALSKALAAAAGIDALQALEIGLAAEVHDIGLLSVPEEILAKRTPWSEGERRAARRHVEAGAEILCDDRHPRVFLAREIARYHHARWDAAGYPERVGGKSIPLPARICAVADAYDAMVSGIGGRVRRTMDGALAELGRQAGKQFDPELVAVFDQLIRTESQDLGMDLASDAGMDGFQELLNSLQEDRGFV